MEELILLVYSESMTTIQCRHEIFCCLFYLRQAQ